MGSSRPHLLPLLVFLVLCSTAVQSGELPGEQHSRVADGGISAAVRAELDELRRQVETLRDQREQQQQVVTTPLPSSSGNRARNDRLTAQWMRSAIRELRAEAEESAASQRRTAADARLQHGEVSSALSLLRSDATSLRKDLEESRANVQRLSASLSQLKAEMTAERTERRDASELRSQMEAELKSVQSEWAQVSKMLKASPYSHIHLVKEGKVVDHGADVEDVSDISDVDEHRLRHFGHFHKQLNSLRQSDKQIITAQMRLEKRVRRIEKLMKTFSSEHSGGKFAKHSQGNDPNCGDISENLNACALKSLVAELEDRVGGMEEAQQISAKSIAFNNSRQTAALDKLHLSTLQLLESVQAVEDKVDHSLPDLQKEISKLEFGMAQAMASAKAAKEERESDQEAIKVIQESLEVLQEKERGEVGALGVVQAQLMNITRRVESGEQALSSRLLRVEDSLAAYLPMLNSKDQERNTSSHAETHLPIELPVYGKHSSDLSGLVHRLTRVQEDYIHIMEQLPKDCSQVSGPSGLYLLHPLVKFHSKDLSENDSQSLGMLPSPQLVYCDQETHGGGWIVIQRRVNGHEDFNRKWDEYQDGFGSPTGEFWIGNEILHQITKGSYCTTLRVDMIDIYGRAWYAEYSSFSVASKSDGFRLHASGYHGNAGDALDYQNGMQFSAKDSDRDSSSTDCAASYEGGWWFSHCQHANLNGRYGLGLTWFDGSRNEWIAVAQSVMKIRQGGNNGKCPDSNVNGKNLMNESKNHMKIKKEEAGVPNVMRMLSGEMSDKRRKRR